MIYDSTVKPVNPKNGDRYCNKQGEWFEMRYGTWVNLDDNKS